MKRGIKMENKSTNFSALSQEPSPAVSASIRKFSSFECAVSWICILAGYLFCRISPVSQNQFGGFLFIFALFAVMTAVFIIQKRKLNKLQKAALASAVIMDFSLIVCANSFLNSLSYFYCIVVFVYYVYSVFGNSLKKGFNNYIVFDFFKAMFIIPFYSIGDIFVAMASGKLIGKSSLKLIIGIIIAIIPTSVIFLLLSYDSGFMQLISDIFKFNMDNVFSHIFSLILAVPIGMYLFGLYISAYDKKCKDIITSESIDDSLSKMQKVPSLTALTATLPIIFLYIVFFISQWKYYISAFTGKLLNKYTYAEYAREGFFQLCAVAIINLAIIIITLIFMKRKDGKISKTTKLLSLIFSLSTLILISTAIAKMIMYIDFYGLTQKRLYATWFMIIIAIVFVMITVFAFVQKFNCISASVAVVVIMFAALTLSNADRLIAKYNVDRYLSGSLETVDIEAMDELGDAAIPELVRLGNKLKIIIKEDYTQYDLYCTVVSRINAQQHKNDKFFSMSIPSKIAEKSVEKFNSQNMPLTD
jgi:hypothetical protein